MCSKMFWIKLTEKREAEMVVSVDQKTRPHVARVKIH